MTTFNIYPTENNWRAQCKTASELPLTWVATPGEGLTIGPIAIHGYWQTDDTALADRMKHGLGARVSVSPPLDQFRALDSALNGPKPVHVDTGNGIYIVRSLDDTGHALVIYLGAPT